jgi:hypothetical protein
MEKLFKVFLSICLLESICLIMGSYPGYLHLIGFQEYMSAKGTSSGTAFGFFGSRIITPMFNASVGGMVLGFLFGYYLLCGRKLLALLTVIPLIFTVSKTGYLIFLVFLVCRGLSGYGFLGGALAYLALSLLFLTGDVAQLPLPGALALHMASIKYHMHGLTTGLEVLLLPVGLGNAGTTPGTIMPELIGRESGFGTGIGTAGLFYIIPFVICCFIFIKKYKNLGFIIVSGYFMVALMNEGSSTFYVWVPILALFLSKPKLMSHNNNAVILKDIVVKI